VTTPGLYDSLTIGETIELMGQPGGVPSLIPELTNATGQAAVFQLLAPPQGGGSGLSYGMSYDLGAPQATTDIVQSLLLDGERPFGFRASNREIHLPVKITAPDIPTMNAARELLLATTDRQTWTLTWTPVASGLPLVFDCFRALPPTITYGFLMNQDPITVVTLHFQALPYGRSDTDGLQQVAFASPLLGGIAAPPAPVVLDNFGTVSGANWSANTQKFVTGPTSAHWTPPAAAWGSVCTYSKSGLGTLNLTGLPVLSVWAGLSYDTAHFGPWPAMKVNLTLAWTLTDNAAHTIKFSRTYASQRWSNSAGNPAFVRHTANIPQNVPGFNYSAVTAYSVRISNFIYKGSTVLIRLHAWLDNITANPPSLSAPASQRGVIYTIMGAAGTARTPFSAQFQQPQAGAVQTELTGSGVWWPPLGVTSVQAEGIGGGGAGASRTTAGLGGGGGGGEYAREAALTVAAGTPVPYACGAGGSSGDVQHVITFTSPGAGSWLVPAGVTSIKAECWGSGAGGAPGGGGGGGGEYAMEPSLTVTAGTRVPFSIGTGGSGAGQLPGYGTIQQRNGNATTFGSAATTTTVVTAHGGSTGLLGGTTSGAGGFGSSNSTHFTGGAGGTAPNTGGGGGGSSGGTAANGNLGFNASGSTGGAGASAPAGGGAGGAGAPLSGWPGAGSSPGGGGGGGFSSSYNGGGGNGAAGQVRITYIVAAGAPVAGGQTTFGSAGTTGTVVRANGGASATLNSATGAAGGSGSTNAVHFSGGAGWTTSALGGGGGSSGGSASAGNAATSSQGAAAPAGGGKGANGAQAADAPGSSNSPPGGGGGGADMGTTAQLGGSGGPGGIFLTWTPPLAPFSTLIAHRPGPDAPENLNPCVPVYPADNPDGRQYNVPQVVSGVNSLYRGTYSILLMNFTWDSPSTARQITVTIYQYEYANGPVWTAQLTRSLTPATDITNGLVVMGELTLPVKDMDPSNLSAYYAVSVTDTDQNDQFLDVLFLDTQGQTVIINIPAGNAYTNFFIDEPTSDRDLGRIMGSNLDRSQAISCLDSCIVSGGPFYLLPGDNTFLAYSPTGAPNLGVSYLSRWYADRIS
jgi:hypothetical protein